MSYTPITSSVCTFDQSPPRRPLLEDLGGDQKENELGYEPDPITDPSADEYNQRAGFLAAIARIMFVARISVTWSGSAYTIASVGAAPKSDTFTAGSITLANPSSGIVTLNWTKDTTQPTLPSSAGPPMLSINSLLSSASFVPWAEVWSDGSGNPGVRIHMPADGSFTVLVG